jgi:N-acetylmuramoyl-L-alanine amidase
MPDYKVKQGDCLESIAFRHGLFWETIWNYPKNSELKEIRKNPNTLLPGDKVFIPEKRAKDESGITEKRHRFKRKGVPSKLRIKLEDEHDEPLAKQPYTIEIDGSLFSGTTDASGWLEQAIPPNARRGKLIIGKNREREFPLFLGDIDPIEELTGIQGRLNNLGFDCGPVDGKLNSETRAAIRLFQQAYRLEESGELNDETRNKLKEIYGS